MSSYAKFVGSMCRQGRITAKQVWELVPKRITKEEAEAICGPRPEGDL